MIMIIALIVLVSDSDHNTYRIVCPPGARGRARGPYNAVYVYTAYSKYLDRRP